MTTAESGRTKVVLYFQVTLGDVHRARVRALDEIPGIHCVGVQFASRELTRGAVDDRTDAVRTIARGTYEEIPRARLVYGAYRLARELRADAAIIDCPADFVQFATGRALQLAGVATYVRWASTRGDYARSAWKEFAKTPFYRGWDGYLATGSRALAYLKTFGVPRRRIVECGNPVDGRALEAPQHSRARKPAFLFVGRFIWHKNLLGLLDAFDAYRARGGTFELRIAGDGVGEYAERVRKRSRSTPGVVLLGFVTGDELVTEYADASCLVLPSLSENWGLVANEAMHAGLPVIVSENCGCAPELVRDSENGYVVRATEASDIERALREIEAAGPLAREAMGLRSRELVQSQSLDRWAREVAAALRAAAR